MSTCVMSRSCGVFASKKGACLSACCSCNCFPRPLAWPLVVPVLISCNLLLSYAIFHFPHQWRYIGVTSAVHNLLHTLDFSHVHILLHTINFSHVHNLLHTNYFSHSTIHRAGQNCVHTPYPSVLMGITLVKTKHQAYTAARTTVWVWSSTKTPLTCSC
jgi:hypothetical protein